MKEFWDKRFGGEEYIYGELPNAYVKSKLGNTVQGRYLFPAEGEGRNAVYTAQLGVNVVAFDQSEQGKRKAELLANKKGVELEYLISDMENISLQQEGFDGLVMVFAHFPAPKRREYHQKLATYLKKGGVLILEGFSKKHAEYQATNPTAGGPRNIDMLYDLDEIKSDFEGFEFIEAYETDTDLSEGEHHKGLSAVIRILAKKK